MVCRRWLQEIETCVDIGLSILIDDREKGLLEYCLNTVVKEARIKYLGCKELPWLDFHLDTLKTLILEGYINPMFMSANLLQQSLWINLTKLYFYGTSLISQDFVQHEKYKHDTVCVFPNFK